MTPFQVPEGPFTIEQIMAAIREQVIEPTAPGERVPAVAPAALPESDDRLRETLALLARRLQTEPDYRIHSHRPFLGRLLDPIKRLIHWGSRPYTEVARRRQDDWNAIAIQALRQVLDRFENTALRMQEVERRLSALERRHRLVPFFSQVTGEKRLAALDDTRGVYADIWMRQKPYLDYFRGLPGQVLDIGCGRGELLAMLRQEGIECWGVDPDPMMVRITRATGVHAVEGDGIAALQSLAPGALGGLFAAQVVEHLFPGELLELLMSARRVLATGGVLILETLNPASLGVLAKSYYRDLDHKQPIHPDYLKQLAELAGFEQVELHYLHPFGEDECPPALPPAEALGLSRAAHEALRRRFERVDALLYGPQDYFIVARQGAPANRSGGDTR